MESDIITEATTNPPKPTKIDVGLLLFSVYKYKKIADTLLHASDILTSAFCFSLSSYKKSPAMNSLIPNGQPTISETDEHIPVTCLNSTEDQEDPGNLNSITSHLYLRPTHTSQKLDKDVVLRRIRHRKRMDKLKTTLQGLVSWPQSVKTDKVSVTEKKWVDDAFAAP